MLRISGKVPLHPTENPEKVKASVLNIFPDAKIQDNPDHLSFSSVNADRFVEIMTDHRIRDTALMIMKRDLCDDSTSFFLNKQAAFMGVVNFADGTSPLGDIEVKISNGATEIMELTEP